MEQQVIREHRLIQDFIKAYLGDQPAGVAVRALPPERLQIRPFALDALRSGVVQTLHSSSTWRRDMTFSLRALVAREIYCEE